MPATVGAEPALTSIFSTKGRRPHLLAMLVAAVLSGAAAGAVTAPIAAPIVAGAVLVGCLVPWSRLLFVLAPLGLLGATGAYMVVQQRRHQYPSNIGWPEQFPVANTLTWMAVCALLAGAVVEVARWRGWLAGEAFEQPKARTEPSTGPTGEPEELTGEPEELTGEPEEPTREPEEPSTEDAEPSTEDAERIGPPHNEPEIAEPELVPATKVEPSLSADDPKHVDPDPVADLTAAVPTDREQGEPIDEGPLRSALGFTVRWLKTLVAGTLSSRPDVPNGGEPPSDDA